MANGGVSSYEQEAQIYGVFYDLDTITPEAVSSHGDCDVVGMNDPPMPPENYHYTSVTEMEQRRCSDVPKSNDFKRKVNEFQSISGRANN